MKNKTNLITFGKVILASVVIIAGILIVFRANSKISAEALEIKSVASTIQGDGAVTAQNQATLHFQTAGKLVYLPFKVGDQVYQGQIIAQLDTAKLQATLRQAMQDFTAAQAVLQKYYDGRDPNAVESFDDKIKRTAIDAAQNKAYDSIVKARQDISDASLVSPINGVITQEDVSITNVNITTITGFTVSDPSILVFRANLAENDIDFVSVGNSATVNLGSGSVKQIVGTVSKIYPDKITLSSGQRAYQVEIQSIQAGQFNLISQSGTALIQSNSNANVKLVPTWTVLNHDSIWVLVENKPVLRHVSVGKTHGDVTEILSGLTADDKVITNPQSIAARKYTIL